MTNEKVSIIRPGIMVSLKSTVSGGVSYVTTAKQEVTPDAPVEGTAASDGEDTRTVEEPKRRRRKRKPIQVVGENGEVKELIERWETTKIVQDPEEHERATKTRGMALTLIRKLCSPTAFGLLCPEAREPELNQAIQAARALAEQFNATSKFTHVHIYALKGRIAATDEEAARAIGQEVRSLLETMNTGIDRLDAKTIREAAEKAREMEAMLAPEQAEKVNLAVEQARKAARQIVARIEKKGEDAAVVLDDISRASIEKARIAFLDFDDNALASDTPSLPAVDVTRFADGLDYAIGEGN